MPVAPEKETILMEIIGEVTLEDLDKMKTAGLTPQEAIDRTLEEAKLRYPQAETIIIQRSKIHTGFDIVKIR